MLTRIERTDVLNAAALAAVLLFLGYLVLTATGWLSEAVDAGLWTAEGGQEEISETLDFEGANNPLLRPPNEVSIVIGNGTEGRQGLAARATRRLDGGGYGTLEPVNKDGPPQDESFVYYIDGYKVDAIQIASVLNIAESQVRPLLANPGVPTDGADVVVILGQKADF